MLPWVIITTTAGQHNHRWTEGAIVDYMEQHPSRAYFSRLFRNGGLRTGMEVGVADGRFSEHFLLDAGDRIRKWYMVEPAPNAELVARFPAASLASTSAAASSPGLLVRLWSRLWNGGGRSWQSRGIGTRTEIIHLPHLSLDPNIFSTVPPRSVDFIYIDSSHLYEVTKKELSAYWRLLRRGGVLAGHDYCDHGESATTATSHVCRGCHPVPRCLPYTEYGLAHGKPLGAPSKSQTSVVKAVQEWVVLNGRTLHFTSETFTRSNLRADGMEYDLLLTSTRNPSWFVVKGRGNIGPVPTRRARSPTHVNDSMPDPKVACKNTMQRFGDTPSNYLSLLSKESEMYGHSPKFKNKVEELWGRRKVDWKNGRIGEIVSSLNALVLKLPVRSVLDLGAGPGLITMHVWRQLKANGLPAPSLRVEGVELTSGWVEAGKGYASSMGINVSMHQGDITAISLGSKFDLIYMADSVEHVPFYRRGALWRTISAHSRPGTRLYFHYPNVAMQLQEAKESRDRAKGRRLGGSQYFEEIIPPKMLSREAMCSGFRLTRMTDHSKGNIGYVSAEYMKVE